MIALLIKSYLAILLSVGIGSVFIFTLGLYFILRKPSVKSKETSAQIPAPSMTEKILSKANLTDLTAIAGEDVIATKLDLARAYIEADMNALAKQILDSVVKQGNKEQQEEAQRLLSL